MSSRTWSCSAAIRIRVEVALCQASAGAGSSSVIVDLPHATVYGELSLLRPPLKLFNLPLLLLLLFALAGLQLIHILQLELGHALHVWQRARVGMPCGLHWLAIHRHRRMSTASSDHKGPVILAFRALSGRVPQARRFPMASFQQRRQVGVLSCGSA